MEHYTANAFSSINMPRKRAGQKFDPRLGAKAYILLIERFIWEVVNENEKIWNT